MCSEPPEVAGAEHAAEEVTEEGEKACKHGCLFIGVLYERLLKQNCLGHLLTRSSDFRPAVSWSLRTGVSGPKARSERPVSSNVLQAFAWKASGVLSWATFNQSWHLWAILARSGWPVIFGHLALHKGTEAGTPSQGTPRI